MHALRRTVLAVAAALAALAAAPAASSYAWPVRPFHAQHPIRGFFGDPRTVFLGPFSEEGLNSAGSFSFHNGVDISAPNAAPVYPVVTGIVRILDASALSVKTLDGHRSFQYFHVVPVVRSGQLVIAGTTVLGHVRTPFAHVHLSEIDDGHITNPLLPGHLEPYRDRTKPSVRTIELSDAAGSTTAPAVVCGRIEIGAEASDTPPVPVPPPRSGMPLAPAAVSWGLRTLSGETILPLRVAVDFRRSLPPLRDFWQVYARGTYQNAPRFGPHQLRTLPGRYVYRIADLDTRRLVDGVYLLRVVAVDERGNRGTLTRRLWVDNAAPCPGSEPAPAPAPTPAPAPAPAPVPAPPPGSGDVETDTIDRGASSGSGLAPQSP